MTSVTLYHNPRCSKSRRTLALFQDKGVQPELVHYLETPPDAARLSALLELLGLQPRELMRRQEAPYRTLDLDNPRRSREELIDAMIRHPILIERPIAVGNGRAAIGRPPENALSVL